MKTTTYSRKAKRPLDSDVTNHTLSKRRRLDPDDPAAITSSSPPPDGHNVWDSNSTAADAVSPPSSPPPANATPSEELDLKENIQPATTPVGKKLRVNRRMAKTRRPLSNIINANPSTRLQPKPEKPRLTQLQIDIGGETRKTCNGCGMEYIPSNAEDAALHKVFHARNTQGIYIGSHLDKAVTGGRERTRVKADQHREADMDGAGRVSVVDRKSSLMEKAKAKMALERVNLELAAVDIDDESLWGQVVIETGAKTHQALAEIDKAVSLSPGPEKGNKADQFKVYLYMRGGNCVGLCLAERISRAYQVLEDEPATKEEHQTLSHSSSISVGGDACPAILGISRIWTSSAHRRQGIAVRLLEAAQTTFIYGMRISKDAMAFSQPSESGKHLAERWFGASAGWKVYTER